MNNMTISDTDRINWLQARAEDFLLREWIDSEIRKKWNEPIKEPIRLKDMGLTAEEMGLTLEWDGPLRDSISTCKYEQPKEPIRFVVDEASIQQGISYER